MKKIIILVAFCIMLTSCNDDIDIDNIDDGGIPIITLNGEQNITLEVGSEYTELNAVALLNDEEINVDITGTVDINVLGEYQIKYNAESDNNLLADQIIRTVSVVDTTAPIIAFSELYNFTYELGIPFSYNQIVKADNYDNESDIDIIMTGSIDVDTPGSYELSFLAVDTNGNESITITETFVVEEREELDYFHRYMKDNTSLYDPDPFLANYLFDEIEKVYRGLVLNDGESELVYYFFLHNVYQDGGMLEKIEFVCPDSDNDVYELEDSQLDYIFEMPLECVRYTAISIITYAHDDYVSTTRSWNEKFYFSSADNLSIDSVLDSEFRFGNIK